MNYGYGYRIYRIFAEFADNYSLYIIALTQLLHLDKETGINIINC